MHMHIYNSIYRLVAPFLTLTPELCMVIEDDVCVEEYSEDGDDPDGERPVRVNGDYALLFDVV